MRMIAKRIGKEWFGGALDELMKKPARRKTYMSDSKELLMKKAEKLGAEILTSCRLNEKGTDFKKTLFVNLKEEMVTEPEATKKSEEVVEPAETKLEKQKNLRELAMEEAQRLIEEAKRQRRSVPAFEYGEMLAQADNLYGKGAYALAQQLYVKCYEQALGQQEQSQVKDKIVECKMKVEGNSEDV